jgi:hypothetical protein
MSGPPSPFANTSVTDAVTKTYEVNKSLIADYSYGQDVYALSRYVTPLVLYVNIETLNRWGIQLPIKTWADLLSIAELVHQKGGVLAYLECSNPNLFLSLLAQNGGHLYDEEERFVLPKYEKQAKEVLRFLHTMKDLGAAEYPKLYGGVDRGDITPDFENGKAGGLLYSDLIYPPLNRSLQSQSGDWRVVPIPVWSADGYKGVSYKGNAYSMIVHKDKTQQQTQLIKDFFEFALLSMPMQIQYSKQYAIQVTNTTLFNNRGFIMKQEEFLGGQKVALELRETTTEMAPRNLSTDYVRFEKKIKKVLSDLMKDEISVEEAWAELLTN